MKTQNQASLNRIKAFTLVELIVVITILAILGTIAFLSFQGYSRSARNSKRISDIANIKTTLALFNTKTGRYPEPDSPTEVTYNTNITIRTQGIVGEQVTRQLEKLGKTPLDPLLETEYAYSVLNTKKEYEVGCIFEGEVTALNSKQIINQTLAEEQKYYAYIKGDYNGKIAKASSGAITYIFAVPSIISSNLGNPDLQEQINNKLFVFNGYQNIPDNYKGRNITMTGGFDFGGYNPLILTYSDNIKDLSGSGGFIKDLGYGLKSIYSGSILASNSNYKEIVELDTSDTTKLNQIIGPIINNNLGGEVKILAGTNTVGGITTSRYPGCDTDDISVGKYKVAACNVGSTIAGTTSASYGRLFQWGEMYGRDTDGGTTSTDNVKYVDGIEVTGDSKSSWSDTVTDTTSGGSDRWNGDNSPATQGSCAPGYHVPTNTEWGEIIAELGGDATTFTNTLKVPFAGARVDGGSLQVQGETGVFYTSSPYGANTYALINNSTAIGIQPDIPRGYGLNVRCIKPNENYIAEVINIENIKLYFGSYHSCLITEDGGVKCWGYNNDGQLGNGNNISSNSSVDVSGLSSGVIDLSLGDAYSCALLSDKTVKCWGNNGDGQLGDGTTTDSNIPVVVSGLTGVEKISAGHKHTCVLTESGGVKCWGANGYGQLGVAVKTGVIQDVNGLSNGVDDIDTGFEHSCALLNDGGVRCWGNNSAKQLGVSTSFVNNPNYVTPIGLTSGVNSISLGFEHACALLTTGGVKCWGNNFYGQLGNGENTDSFTVNVTGLITGVDSISLGLGHSCALLTSGGVKCWGWNTVGQLGNNSTTNSNIPVQVDSLLTGVGVLYSGGAHNCILPNAGGIKCWGNNDVGQFGNGTNTSSLIPINITLQ